MEIEACKEMSAHEVIKRSAHAGKVLKLFLASCSAKGIELEAKHLQLYFSYSFCLFVEKNTGVKACLEVSQYKVKSGTKCAVKFFAGASPDGRYGRSQIVKKRGALSTCIEHAATGAAVEMACAHEWHIARQSATAKLKAAGGEQLQQSLFLFDEWLATVECDGTVGLTLPASLSPDDAFQYLSHGYRKAA